MPGRIPIAHGTGCRAGISETGKLRRTCAFARTTTKPAISANSAPRSPAA